MFVIFFPFIYYTTSHLGHIRVHIFNRQISDEHTKSLRIKTEQMPRAVVRLGSIFNRLIYDWLIFYYLFFIFGV
jgi:hypothetical protein